MLGDVAQGRSRDALQGELGLLDAQHEEGDGARLDDGGGEVGIVPGDVSERPSRGFLHPGVELLQALHEGIERPGVNHGLREGRGVLRHRAEDEGGRLLVEAVLLGQGVDELREDLVAHDSLGEVIAVVGQAPERDRGRLLDAAIARARAGRGERGERAILGRSTRDDSARARRASGDRGLSTTSPGRTRTV